MQFSILKQMRCKTDFPQMESQFCNSFYGKSVLKLICFKMEHICCISYRCLFCMFSGPCGLCGVFRQLGCFLCSVINMIVQCLFGLVMLVWCAVGGVLHCFIADTVLRDVWLLSKYALVNFCKQSLLFLTLLQTLKTHMSEVVCQSDLSV